MKGSVFAMFPKLLKAPAGWEKDEPENMAPEPDDELDDDCCCIAVKAAGSSRAIVTSGRKGCIMMSNESVEERRGFQ